MWSCVLYKTFSYYGDKIKENETDRARGMYGGETKYTQNFCAEIEEKKLTLMIICLHWPN